VKTFQVYFSQVNQTRFEVRAQDEGKAVEKAERIWRAENGWPTGAHVEEVAETGDGK
jgi:hypothetical protein